ncbi:MAG: hypothetical protein H6Q70_470 [Firmicutes bacterium]|nr:hypothetical protein [Bacillota bacterium]
MTEEKTGFKRVIKDGMYCILTNDSDENELSAEVQQSIEDFKEFVNKKYSLNYK